MNNKFTYIAFLLLLYFILESSISVLAAEYEIEPLHFRKKPGNEYPLEIYVQYKPIQYVNKNGFNFDLVYVNKTNEDQSVVLDDNFCEYDIYNNNKIVTSTRDRIPKGYVKFMSPGIYPEDGEVIKKGVSKKTRFSITKIVGIGSDKSNKDKIDVSPSKYGIQLHCLGAVFTIGRPKVEVILLPIETNIFYITYKNQ